MNDSDITSGWSVLPNWVIRDDILHGNEKWVYIALLNRANSEGTCYPSVARIAKDVNISRQTVRSVLKRLEDLGMIQIIERFKEGSSSERDSNLYYIPVWLKGQHINLGRQIQNQGRQIENQGVGKSRTGGGQNAVHEEDTFKNTQLSKANKRGMRIPDSFTVTDEMNVWASKNTPLVDPVSCVDEFIDYWKGVPGQKGVKLDWVSTWRNFMRRQQKFAERDQPKGERKLKRINDYL